MAQEMGSCRLARFHIRLSDGTANAGALYANGRHQCEVVIEAVKEVVNKSGQWERKVLTDEERESITIVELSEELTDCLPEGWSCDEKKNIYSAGVWQSGVTNQVPVRQLDPQVDHVFRYLRSDRPFDRESVKFMAIMFLDGSRYSTALFNIVSKDGAFVVVELAPAYSVPVSDLEHYVDTSAFTESVTLLAVYYWVPPKDLWFVENMGIENPADVPDEGNNFNTVEIYPYGLGSVGMKIGVVINKDEPDLVLRMDDVHKNVPLSVPNPLVRFNERPTIMRAVRLIASVFPSVARGGGIWRLVDNFGNQHRYFLWLDGANIKLEHRPEFRISSFFVRFPNGQDYTNALYANGLHQCKVHVELVIEQQDFNGNWERVRLTKQQRDSVTITRYSTNPDESLPAGWSVDKIKNIYDEGLWRGGGVEPVGADDEQIQGVTEAMVETIDLYMRFNEGVPIETMKFMAKVIINGVAITTNQADGDQHFDSSITILPTRPYTIDVSGLTHASFNSYRDAAVDIDVYYWQFPAGLQVLESKGLDDRIYQGENEGSDFFTSYANNRGFARGSVKAGVMHRLNYPGARVRISNIHKRLFGDSTHDPDVKVDHMNTKMFAVRLISKLAEFSRTGDAKGKWRLVDNFGCEHVYWMSHTNDWSQIVLNNG